MSIILALGIAGAIGAVSAGVTAFFTGAALTAAILLEGAALGVLSGVLSYGASMLMGGGQPSPRSYSMPAFSSEAQDRIHMIRSAVAPHKIIYGKAMVSGPLVFAASNGDGNEFLHMVIPLAGHEVEEIGDIYLNDRTTTDIVANKVIDVKFYPSEFYGIQVSVNDVLYRAGADYDGLDELVAVITDSPGYAAETFTVEKTGNTLRFTSKGDGRLEVPVASIAGRSYPNDGWSHLWVKNTPYGETKTRAQGDELIFVKKHLGHEDQWADADLISAVEEWTGEHRLRGIAYIYVRLKWDQTVWATGIPNIKAIVKGRKVYDPRTGQTAWSDNWALCLRDYLTADFGVGATASEIDDDLVIAAANLADETVTGPAGASNKRYTCNGVISLDAIPPIVVEQMASAGAGAVVYTQGKYRIYGGAYQAPALTIDESYLRGPIAVKPRKARKDLFNGVRGTYVDPDKFWQPQDFPPVVSTVFKTEDGDEEIIRDIELPFTTNPATAQQIAKIILEQSRQAITVDFPANFKAVPLAVWDNVALSIERMGWDNKVFKVLSWRLNPEGGVDLTLIEDAASAYSWDDGDIHEIDTAPNTNLPSAWNMPPPTNLLVNAAANADLELIPGVHADDPPTAKTGGDTFLSWTPPIAAMVARYEVQHLKLLAEVIQDNPRKIRVVQATVLSSREVPATEAKLFIAASELALRTTMDHNGAELLMLNQFAVRAINSVGAASQWSDTYFIEYAPPQLPNRVTGLELDLGGEGGGLGSEWTGKDVKIKWRAGSTTNQDLSNEQFGADDGGPDPQIKDYQVEVLDQSGNQLREEYVTDLWYIYSYEKNAEDYARVNGEPGANRYLQIAVRMRGMQNQLSEAATL